VSVIIDPMLSRDLICLRAQRVEEWNAILSERLCCMNRLVARAIA